MQTARRLYLYLVSGVALGFVLFGLQSLLQVLLDTLGMHGNVLGGGTDSSQQLSVALALVGVGTPVWLLHWWFAERSVQVGRDGSSAERQSTVRALYFAGLLGILLALGAAAANDLLLSVLDDPMRLNSYYGSGPASAVASVVVVGAAWLYHGALRRRDMHLDELRGPAVWLPRTYLYLAAFSGLVWSLLALIPVLRAVWVAILGEPLEAYEWSGSVGPAVIGIGIWIGHKWYTDRLLLDPGWRGASEREARLRLAYLVAVIVVGVAGTVAMLSLAIQPAVVAWLGTSSGGGALAPAVLGPLSSAVTFLVLGWWFHARALRREARDEPNPDRPTLVWRLERTSVALTGLAFAAVGSARLIGLMLDTLAGRNLVVIAGEISALDLGLYVPFAVIGGGVWLSAWIQLERRRVADPVVEAQAPVRRAALLIVLAAAVIAGLASLALILYRLFGFLLGAGLTGDALVELSTPIGILVVAVVGGLYHGLALRRDQALAPAEPVAESAAEPAAVEASPEPGIGLTLRGPDGTGLEDALAAARVALPEGYRLERD